MIPKFRAWDKEKELMGEVVQINFEIDTIEYVAFTDLYVWSNFEKVELMQSTGLQDKNGVEIYEGDIVMHMGSLYTPVYERAIYMAYDVKQFNLNNKEPITQFNCIWRDDGCEIVGNTYENKELLQ